MKCRMQTFTFRLQSNLGSARVGLVAQRFRLAQELEPTLTIPSKIELTVFAQFVEHVP